MIAKASMVDTMLNSKFSEVSIDTVSFLHEVDAFKIYNDLVYQILSKIFTDMDAYVYLKQQKSSQDAQAVYFDIHKGFLGTDHVTRQAAETERKLQTSHYEVQLGQVCYTPQGTACCHGEPYRL